MGFRRGIAVFLGAAILCAALPCRTWAAESGLQMADTAFVSPFLSDFSVTDGEGRQMFSGGDFVEAYRLTAGTQSIAAYSAEPAGQPADTYRRVNLEDTGRFDALTAGKIRAVVLNTYPCREVPALQTAANAWLRGRGLEEIRELQSGETVLAAQLALWQLADPEGVTVRQYVSGWEDMTTAAWRDCRNKTADADMLSQKPTEWTAWNVEALYRFYAGLSPAEPGLETVSEAALANPEYITLQQSDGTYTVTVSVDIQTDVGARDELTLTAFCGSLTYAQAVPAAGTYSVRFDGLTERPEVRLVLSGIQHGGDVYLFEGEGRSLVGFDDSLLPVRGELTVKPDSILNLTETTEDGVPLANIRFDLYRVDNREQEPDTLPAGKALEEVCTPGNLVTILTTDIHGFASYNFTANGQPEGVYLVAQRYSAATGETAAPFFVRIPGQAADGVTYTLNVHPISTPEIQPTVQLDVEGQESASFDAGQPHTWTARSSVPAGIATAQRYTLTDYLDRRLEYEPGSLRAFAAGWDGAETELREGDHYTLTVTDQSMSFSLTPAGMAYAGAKGADGEILLRFQTAIRETAEPGVPIANRIGLSYLNSAGISWEAESGPAEVHTGGIRLRLTNEAGQPLAGASFRIDRGDTPAAEGVTGEDGTIAFTGLAYGAYALVQTKAPEGYNVLSRPVPVTVNETSHLTAEDGWRDAGGQIADSTVQLINTEAIPPKTGDAVHVVFVIGGSTLIGLVCAAGLELTVRTMKRRSRR